MSDPIRPLGQRILRALLGAWLTCFGLAVAAGFTLGENVTFDLLGVLLILSAALVAAPAVLFVVYVERHPPGAVPREMRRSALGSGLSGLFAAAVLFSFPRPAWIFMAPAAALAAVGALAVFRAVRLAAPDPALAAPALHHRTATTTGVIAIVLFVILAAKL